MNANNDPKWAREKYLITNFGLSRTTLTRMRIAKHIISASFKEDDGKQGARLYHLGSVREYLRRLPLATLQDHADLLNPRQLLVCVARCRPRLISYLRTESNPSYKMVHALHSIIDQLDPKTAAAVRLALATQI